ncbi:MAG: aldo/keto reductase [Algisphaera sp.]
MPHTPSPTRYTASPPHWFRHCGQSGLQLPALSLGGWHNFGGAKTDSQSLGETDLHANAQAMLFTAFDHGITHIDMANNYGPPPGSAETRVGRILKQDLAAHRDELLISSKAGYDMWPGPYGDGGSRKYLHASLDQSLKRLQLDYVDIFYSHRFDPNTPLAETLGALDSAVRNGKALYVGLSNYTAEQTQQALAICKRDGLVKPIIHQPKYSLLDREIESELIPAANDLGMGIIVYCPLAQGLLTPKYLNTVPTDSRAKTSPFLSENAIDSTLIARLNQLNTLANSRGQTLAQMALSWVLNTPHITSAIIGASRPQQIIENIAAAEKTSFTHDERATIEEALS